MSSSLSPMPMMPPQQVDSPARLDVLHRRTPVGELCVVQMSGWKRSLVFRLWLTQPTPDAFKLARLLFAHQAEAHADLDIRETPLDASCRRRSRRAMSGSTRAAAAGHHAVASRSAAHGVSRSVYQRLLGEQAIARDLSGGDRGLRAVVAVLGTKTAARVLEHATLHAPPEGGLANSKCLPEQRPSAILVRSTAGATARPLPRERFAAKNVVGEGRERGFSRPTGSSCKLRFESRGSYQPGSRINRRLD